MIRKIRKAVAAGSVRLFFLLMFFLVFNRCMLESDDPVLIDNKVDIYFVNSQQEDLLDTSLSGSYSSDSIHLYNVVRGIKNEVENRNVYPNNFFIYRNELLHKYVLRVFVEKDTTLLELNFHTTDTITCTFSRAGGNFIISKVLYNGSIKWDDFATSREIVIVK